MLQHTVLAIDDNQFVLNEGISISLEEPRADHVQPILGNRAKGAVDNLRLQFDGTVLKDGPVWKMWYIANPYLGFSAVAYAESDDGLNWNRPNLNLVDFNGNKSNNLVKGLPGDTDCISVIKDDDGLFKAAVMKMHYLKREHVKDLSKTQNWDSEDLSPAFAGIAVSEDGFNWNFCESEIPPICEKLETCRLYKLNGKYIMNGQQAWPWAGKEWRGRVVSFFESEDLITWKKLDVLYQNSKCQCHVGIAPQVIAGSTIVGFSGRFIDAPEIPDQHFEIGLVISNDGINWREPVPDQAYIRRGQSGNWNGGGIIQGQGTIVKNGMMHIYYSGVDIGNTPFSRIQIGKFDIIEHRFGFAALKVGWDLGFRGRRFGRLVSKTIDLTEYNSITLNCDGFERGGIIRCALLDDNNQPIEGFSFNESLEITQGGREVQVCWSNSIELPAKKCRLGIELEGGIYRMESPKLYSISFCKYSA